MAADTKHWVTHSVARTSKSFFRKCVAARTLGELDFPLRKLVNEPERMDALPGIGPDLAGKIVEVLQTGSCALLERLKKELPAGVTALLKIPRLGPRRVRQLLQDLDIQTLEQLRQAAQDRRLQSVHGFGARTEQRILESINGLQQQPARHKRAELESLAQALLDDLAGLGERLKLPRGWSTRA